MDDVLPLYNRELEFLRRQAGKFADAHPKVAGRLRIGPEMADDPHVERLIEAVALLNARVRLKLEDEFPELTEAVLNALYPHYLAPVPPMGIARMEASTALSEPFEIARGTELETGAIDGERCRLRTTQALTLWPFEVTQVGLQGRPFRAPVNPRAQGALSVLHIRLATTNESATFGDLQPDPIRFYLGGAGARALPLYELLRNRLLGIAVCEQPDEPNTVFLPPTALRPVGFARDEAILPYPSRSFVGYRLLTEYFALPQKFLFFEINGVSARMLAGAGRELSIYLYLADTDAELERGVTTADLSTGCVPVVNLFPLRAEPIRLDGTAFEHRIVPDARRPDALEVYMVDKVTASDVDGNEYPFEPFFGLRHDAEGDVRFWHVARRQAASARDKGNELFISLLDRDADAGAPANWTLSVDTLCFNRDLLARIPSVGGQVPLDMVSPSPAVRRAFMASPFSPTRRPPLGNGRMWRLLSHLSLNHLSMAGGEDGGEALREILRLYDWGQGLETRRLIDGVRSVNSKRGLARIVLGRSTAITQGLDVDVLLDPQNYPPGGAYLMACVLEHFFGLYVAVNTFTRLTARLSGRTGVLASWPPRTGEKTLL